jgi:hypothetical protein
VKPVKAQTLARTFPRREEHVSGLAGKQYHSQSGPGCEVYLAGDLREDLEPLLRLFFPSRGPLAMEISVASWDKIVPHLCR